MIYGQPLTLIICDPITLELLNIKYLIIRDKYSLNSPLFACLFLWFYWLFTKNIGTKIRYVFICPIDFRKQTLTHTKSFPIKIVELNTRESEEYCVRKILYRWEKPRKTIKWTNVCIQQWWIKERDINYC